MPRLNTNFKNALEEYDLSELLYKVKIESMDDVHDAAQTIKDLGDECGFRIALCDDISSRDPMVDADGTVLSADIFGWTTDGERWWEESCLALHSPLVRACRYESEPFWCNKNGIYGHGTNPYIKGIELKTYFGEYARYDAAMLIPIHLPFAQISANSLHAIDDSVNDLSKEYEYYADFFALLFRRYISGYVAAARKTRRIPGDLVLSKREVECLQWAAIGKTDKDIATIISLSHATIRYHIHRAGEKLYSVNRAQTIFKAGQLGFLGASD
jgi:DNA-binding CsgD family transcriptional regulator